MDRRAFIGGLLATTAFPLTSDDHGFTRLELAGWRIVGPVHSAQYEWVEIVDGDSYVIALEPCEPMQVTWSELSDPSTWTVPTAAFVG